MKRINVLLFLTAINFLLIPTSSYSQENSYEIKKLTPADTLINPFGCVFIYKFEISTSGNYKLEFFKVENNLASEVVSYSFSFVNFEKGKYEFNWLGVNSAPKGKYFYRLKENDVIKDKHSLTIM